MDKDSNTKNNIKITKQLFGKNVILIAILISLLIMILTTILIVKKINILKEKYKIDDTYEEQYDTEDLDKIYLAHEGDTYNFNDIDLEEHYYYIDGRDLIPTAYDESPHATYYKIIGLKDKEVEEKINERFKVDSINFFNENPQRSISVAVICNKSNVLSLELTRYDNINKISHILKIYNIDLNTGNDIKLEDLFIKSTPINSIVYGAFLKGKAWEKERNLDFSVPEVNNTEVYLYKIKDTYNIHKDDLNFLIYDGYITLYNLDSSGNYTSDIDSSLHGMNINLYDVKDYCTFYKRYAGDIYDKDVRIDGINVFYTSKANTFESGYGLKDRNCFINNDTILLDINFVWLLKKDYNIFDSIKRYVYDNDINDFLNLPYDNEYVYVVQGIVNSTKYSDMAKGYNFEGKQIIERAHYKVNINAHVYKVKRDFWMRERTHYFGNAAKNYYVSFASPTIYEWAGQGDEVFNNIMFINNDPSGIHFFNYSKLYYFDLNGSYLGDNIECVQDYNY